MDLNFCSVFICIFVHVVAFFSSPPAATPPSSRPATRSTANRNSAPRAWHQPPTAPGRANKNSRLGQPLWRSARLTPRACAIKSHPQPAAPQLRTDHKMARTYPLSLKYGQCLGHLEDPYAFSSLFLEDLHSGRREYLTHIQQLIDALPKSLDPTSCFALRAQVIPPGHQHLRHSLRAALWWLLLSNGDFRRASNGLQYYLARQGRRVVLRGGDITVPFHESRLCWIHDPTPSPPRPMERTFSVPPSDSSATNSSDSSVSIPSGTSAPISSDSMRSHTKPVSVRNKSENEASAIATRGSSGAPLTPSLPKKCQRRRQARRAANRNSAASSAAQ